MQLDGCTIHVYESSDYLLSRAGNLAGATGLKNSEIKSKKKGGWGKSSFGVSSIQVTLIVLYSMDGPYPLLHFHEQILSCGD